MSHKTCSYCNSIGKTTIMEKLDNPFVEYGYFGLAYFCDREEETRTLLLALHNNRNVTLMAPQKKR